MRVDRRNIGTLDDLNAEIHDKWFSVDKLVFDELKHEFVLFFGATQGVFDRCLKVKRVLDCKIDDTEKIGMYDINYLSLDLQASQISIVGCIPITITLIVAPDFEISINAF